MADIIKHKRSATAAAVPTAGQLSLGELAINTADGTVYLKKSDGSVVLLGADREAAIPAGTTAQYWRGDKTWQDLPAAVRASVLTGLYTGAASDVYDTDTLLIAIGKLQASKVQRYSATSSARIPAGTTAQRPLGATGDFRLNTSTGVMEFYNASAWNDVGGAVKSRGTAWVNFNGVSGAVRDSFNVSSVTRISTGIYQVSFSSPMASTAFAFSGAATDDNVSSTSVFEAGTFGQHRTVNSFRVVVTGNGAVADRQGVYLNIFGGGL